MSQNVINDEYLDFMIALSDTSPSLELVDSLLPVPATEIFTTAVLEKTRVRKRLNNHNVDGRNKNQRLAPRSICQHSTKSNVPKFTPLSIGTALFKHHRRLLQFYSWP
jgi:hypothetical protein